MKKLIRRFVFWLMNVSREKNGTYIYVHDLDNGYKFMYKPTFDYLPEEIKAKMLQ